MTLNEPQRQKLERQNSRQQAKHTKLQSDPFQTLKTKPLRSQQRITLNFCTRSTQPQVAVTPGQNLQGS